MTSVYKQDGVDLSAGDTFSEYCGKRCAETYGNSAYVQVIDNSEGDFRGPRTYRPVNLPENWSIGHAPDGVGTKTILINAALNHKHAGRDILAMTAGDITRYGGLPVVFSDVLDVKTLGDVSGMTFAWFQKIIDGLTQAANEQGIVVLNGETAELRDCVTSEDPDAVTQFNWAGFMVGLFDADRMILGNKVSVGDSVMALGENGFRSNGISSARAALRKEFGDQYYSSLEAKDAVIAAAEPSVLYDSFLCELNGWTGNSDTRILVKMIAHLTGGSIKSKFAEPLFKRGLSANLMDLFNPPAIMHNCGEWRGMNDIDFYETWHGGQGALVVIDREDEIRFTRTAERFGLRTRKAGSIIQGSSTPTVLLKSKFKGNHLIYRPGQPATVA